MQSAATELAGVQERLQALRLVLADSPGPEQFAQLVADCDALLSRLQELDAREHELIDELDGIVWEADPAANRFTFVSPRAVALLGYPLMRWLGEANFWQAIVLDEDRAIVIDELGGLLTDGYGRRTFEFRVHGADGQTVWLRTTAYLTPQTDAHVPQLRGFMEDVTARRRTEQAQALLAQASGLLGGSLDYEAALAGVVRLAVDQIADWGLATLPAPAEQGTLHWVALEHRDPALQPLLEQLRRFPPNFGLVGGGMAQLLRAGKPVLIQRIPDAYLERVSALDPSYLPLMRQLGFSSVLAVPLKVRGHVDGVIAFLVGDRGRRLDDIDLALVEELARRAWLAIDSAQLFEAEQGARRTAERVAGFLARLQAVTGALSEALTPERVAEVVVDQGVAALGARAGALVQLRAAADALDLVRGVGYSPEALQRWQRVAVDEPTPLAEAVRTGQPVQALAGVGRAGRDRLEGLIDDDESLVALPLLVDGRSIGALVLTLSSNRPFAEDERAFMLALARQCAQALERGRLYQAERDARAEAEAAQRWLEFLAEASALLSASLDYEATLTQAARTAVPTLADWCSVAVVRDDGTIARIGLAHTDPEKERLLNELERRFPIDAGQDNPVTAAIQHGRPTLVPLATNDVLASLSKSTSADQAYSDLLRSIGITSFMCVPLIARGNVLGSMVFVSARPERRYTESHLVLAQELARRAAVAADNARLYHEAREALRVRDEFLSTISHDLNTPLTTIKGLAQILGRRAAAGSLEPERFIEGLQTIDSASTKMRGLVGQLLDVARLQAGEPLSLDLRPTNLAALVHQVVTEQQRLHPGHQIRVEVEGQPPEGMWDAARVERVIANLLTNALKYSPEGGEILLRLATERDSTGGEGANGWALLRVHDQGIGIPAADLPHVFERFYRGGNVTGKIAGTGIGLAGARQIVEQHGGSVSVESVEGQGATFTVRLPLSPPPDFSL